MRELRIFCLNVLGALLGLIVYSGICSDLKTSYVEYDDGSTYDGELLEGKRHGTLLRNAASLKIQLAPKNRFIFLKSV